ncbi:MAG: response regulator [Pseudomonadaceae bacterium]|nr:response regulator [Pseudomonadaceae bacterium]
MRDSISAANILVVDDDELDVTLLRRACDDLASGAPSIVWAESGEAALARLLAAPEQPPTLILLDYSMPGRGGIEVLTAIRNDSALAAIPVIILSGSRSPADVRNSYLSGANCYLQKPEDLAGWKQMMQLISGFWLSFAELPEPAR